MLALRKNIVPQCPGDRSANPRCGTGSAAADTDTDNDNDDDARLQTTLVNLNLRSRDEDLVRLDELLERLLMLHFYNEMMREAIWKRENADQGTINVLYELRNRPEINAWGTRDGVADFVQKSYAPLEAGLWPRVFRHMQLAPHNMDGSCGEDLRFLRCRQQLYGTPTAGNGTRVYKDWFDGLQRHLYGAGVLFRGTNATIPREVLYPRALLLFFAQTNLMGKNARDVLDDAQFDFMGDRGRDEAFVYMQDVDMEWDLQDNARSQKAQNQRGLLTNCWASLFKHALFNWKSLPMAGAPCAVAPTDVVRTPDAPQPPVPPPRTDAALVGASFAPVAAAASTLHYFHPQVETPVAGPFPSAATAAVASV